VFVCSLPCPLPIFAGGFFSFIPPGKIQLNYYLCLMAFIDEDDNIIHVAPQGDYLANIIRATGSHCSIEHPEIYRCESRAYHSSAIHHFVLGKRDFTKQTGDTCRMWVKFSTQYDYLYYCWEGFYIHPEAFEKKTTVDGVVTCEHITRLVLTEKIRFNICREKHT